MGCLTEVRCNFQIIAATFVEITNKTYRIDMLVENCVIVELKSVDTINPIYEAQLLTYMKLLNINLGLLINFNVELLKNGIKRRILG